MLVVSACFPLKLDFVVLSQMFPRRITFIQKSASLRNTLNCLVVSFLWPGVYRDMTLFLDMTSPIDIWHSIGSFSIDALFLDNENCLICQRNHPSSSLEIMPFSGLQLKRHLVREQTVYDPDGFW